MTDPRSEATPPTARARRELAVTVVGCLAGAGLALLTARHAWAVAVTNRPAPLPPLRDTLTGSDFAVWLPAAGFVALAAGTALYATRGWGRLAVALVAVLSGVAIAAGAGYGIASGGAGARSAVDAGLWPILCLLGGLLVAMTGGYAALRGRRWPSMGARYERPAPAAPAMSDDPAQMWDSLDAGTDPTQRPAAG